MKNSDPRNGAPLRNIVLTGLPGCGKTTLGSKAAAILNLEFIDLDREIERRAGLSVAEIFTRFGEDRFRDLETEELLKAVARQGLLIAAGGGTLLRDENVKALKDKAFVIFLDRAAEKIAADFADDGTRPLLRGGPERLLQLARERQERYLSAADVILPNQGDEEDGLAGLTAVVSAETASGGCAVIGHPVAHSLSPVIHGAVFKSLGLDWPYPAIDVPPESLAAFVGAARRSSLKGFNITIPHKSAVIPLLDEVDEEAALAGAVNAVTNRRGRLIGFNTDMEGLRASLIDHGHDFPGRNVLILGAGGAAGSLAFKAARSGAARVTILARRVEAADQAAERIRRRLKFMANSGPLTPESMAEEAAASDLVINCTPLGMLGMKDNFQSFDFLDRLPPEAAVCDLIYNPARTALLAEAEKRGLTGFNGLGMLIHQAIAADELFLNRTLDKAKLYRTAAGALCEKA